MYELVGLALGALGLGLMTSGLVAHQAARARNLREPPEPVPRATIAGSRRSRAPRLEVTPGSMRVFCGLLLMLAGALWFIWMLSMMR